MKHKLKDLKLIPIEQNGHVCKTTAIATAERYYAETVGFPLIPLNKRNHKIQLNPKRSLVFENHQPISIRQISKCYGSIQGELLEIRQVQQIFEALGYEIELIDFSGDFNLFKSAVIASINAGSLVFASFSVNIKTKYPAQSHDEVDTKDKNEHAAIIHGYDEARDVVFLTHWGQNRECCFEDFYHSSMLLLDTREPEYYQDTTTKPSVKGYKYEQAEEYSHEFLVSHSTTVRRSITPQMGSGFRGKMVVIKTPFLEQIAKARKALFPIVEQSEKKQKSSVMEKRLRIAQPLILKRNLTRKDIPIVEQSEKKQKSSVMKKKLHLVQPLILESNLTRKDIQFLAHVFLDGEIGGTPLEGFRLQYSLHYIKDFLSWRESLQPQGLNNFDVIDSERFGCVIHELSDAPSKNNDDFFAVLQTYLNILEEFQNKLQKIINACKVDNKKTSTIDAALSELSKQILTSLDANKDLFIEGGFGGRPGHANLYRLSKHGNEIYFCVYNSNSISIPLTSAILPSGEQGFYPVYAFKIPDFADNQHRLTQFLVKLLKLKALPEIDVNRFCYSDEDLCGLLQSAPIWLHASLIPADKLSQPILGITHGVCAWLSAELLLQAIIPAKKDYRQFMLAFRLYCFHRISLKTLQTLPNDLKILLKRSLVNMVRMLNTELKNNPDKITLKEQHQDIIIEHIKRWKNKLKITAPKTNTHILNAAPIHNIERYSLSRHNAVNISQDGDINETENKINLRQSKIIAGKTFDDTLSDLMQKLQNYHSHDNMYTSCIEKFCYYFSNHKKTIVLKTPLNTLEAQSNIIDSLQSVLLTYENYQPQLNSRKIIVYLSLINIVERLGIDGHLRFGNHALTSGFLFGKKLGEFILNAYDNPFLNTYDPKMDMMMSYLMQFTQSEYIDNLQSPLNYYIEIIKQTTASELECLERHWELGPQQESVELVRAVENLFAHTKGSKSYYCFLNIEERTKIGKKKLPQLTAAFKLQEKIESFIFHCLKKIVFVSRGVENSKGYALGQPEPVSLIKNYYFDVSKGELAVSLQLNKEVTSDVHFFLKRDFLQQTDFIDSPLNNALLSFYDGNSPDENEAFYLRTTFSKEAPQLPQVRTRKYPLLTDAPSINDRLAIFLHTLLKDGNCTIISLLSELCAHIDLLVSSDWDIVIQLSIFNSAKLLVELSKQESPIWGLLDKLWNKSKKIHEVVPWILLKLLSRISIYAEDAEYYGFIKLNETNRSQIDLYIDEMLTHVEQCLKTSSEDDIVLLTELHNWRLITCFHVNINTKNDWRSSLYDSYNFLLHAPPLKNQRDHDFLVRNLAKARSFLMVPHKPVRCVPQYIRDSVEFRELFANLSPVVIDKKIIIDECEYDSYCFQQDSQDYRILFSEKNKRFLIQKSHAGLMYTYAATSEKMQHLLGFRHAAFINPPPLFNQLSFRVWIANHDNWMIISAGSDQIIYMQKDGVCYQSGRESQVFYRLTDSIPSLFLRFDDANFIHSTLDADNKPIWYFARYGLEVILGDEEGTYRLKDTTYNLTTPNRDEDWFGTGLVLLDNNRDERFLIIPLQAYYILKNKKNNFTPSPTGAHYMWVHDLSNYIVRKTLEDSQIDYVGFDDFGREQYVKFKFNQQGIPIATSADDALYLAYLYLAQDRPKKAQNLLREYLLQGTYIQMERLWWIITKLPAISDGKKIQNSRVVAVQMKALQLMLKIKQQNPNWYLDKPSSNISGVNRRYHEMEYAKLIDFVKELEKNIKNHYMMYDKMRHQTPSHMLLSPDEEMLLLAHSMTTQHMSNEYSGVIAAKYLEYFPDERAGNIVSYPLISQNNHYYSHKINPSLWIHWYLAYPSQGHDFKIASKPNDRQRATALKKLNPYMDELSIYQNFAIYYFIALAPENNQEQEILREFCKVSIPMFQRSKILRLIGEILWVILDQPKDFPKSFDVPHSGIKIIALLANITKKLGNEFIVPVHLIANHCLSVGRRIYPLTSGKKVHAHLLRDDFESAPTPNLYPPSLIAVQQLLLEIEKKYNHLFSTLFIELKQEISKPFALQNMHRAKLEQEYLNRLTDKKEEMRLVCENARLHEIELDFSKKQEYLQREIDATKKQIESIIERRQKNYIAELGKTIIVPTVAELIMAYPKLNDAYLSNIGILQSDVALLHNLLQKLFSLNDKQKYLHLLNTALQADKFEPSIVTRDNLIGILLPKKPLTRRQDVLFQYINNLSLHPEQINFLSAIFSEIGLSTIPKSQVLQLMMGKGKTKVILPLWAYNISDGENLAIIVVPEMSFQTNYSDLAAMSWKSFQQEPYCLHFDSHASDDLAYIRELYDVIETLRREKRYIVSTATSLQALELKYIDLLKKDSVAPKFIYTDHLFYLSKILCLLREKALLAIDEAHALLDIKRDVIYAVGESVPISETYIKLALDLYYWLHKKLSVIDSYPGIDISPYIRQLCTEITQEEAPVWMKNLLHDSLSARQLAAYLSGKSSSVETIDILAKNPKLKAQWDFLRDEFQTFLPITLQKKLYEHYGPSPDSNGSSAIPYRANSVPTDRVFGHYIEIINYTIQMLFAEGITMDDLKSILLIWQKKAYIDKNIDENCISEVEKTFAEIFNKNALGSLLHIDLSDKQVIKELYKRGSHHPRVLYEGIYLCLQNVRIESEAIHSDSINLVSQVLGVTALTASPENHYTYHQDVVLATETTLGVKGEVKQYLLNSAKIDVILPTSFDGFLNVMLQENQHIYALMDYGGYFCGIDSLQVASIIADICAKNFEMIRYVLYYQGDKLYALNIITRQSKYLPITSEDAIQKELDCLPSMRFTYYDQEHTLGSDICQDDLACGVLTVDVADGELSKMLQAAMRMRRLGDRQKLIIVINESIPSIQALMARLENNENKKLTEKHFAAGLKKINNLFRNDLLKRLLYATDEYERRDLFKKAYSFFVDTLNSAHQASAIRSYEKKPTQKVLSDFARIKKSQWAGCFENGTELNELDSALTNIIQLTTQISEKMQVAQIEKIELEVQPYLEKQNLPDTLRETNNTTIELMSIRYDWINKVIAENTITEQYALCNVIAHQFPEISSSINPNIYGSPNFLYAHQMQKDWYGVYTKHAIAILFLIKDDGIVKGVLLCMKEASLIDYKLYTNAISRDSFVLMTLYGDNYYAASPYLCAAQKDAIQAILEQAQFLTGKIEALLTKPISPWLQHDADKKIQFLENIAPWVGMNKLLILELKKRTFALEDKYPVLQVFKKYHNNELEKLKITWTNKYGVDIASCDELLQLLKTLDKHSEIISSQFELFQETFKNFSIIEMQKLLIDQSVLVIDALCNLSKAEFIKNILQKSTSLDDLEETLVSLINMLKSYPELFEIDTYFTNTIISSLAYCIILTKNGSTNVRKDINDILMNWHRFIQQKKHDQDFKCIIDKLNQYIIIVTLYDQYKSKTGYMTELLLEESLKKFMLFIQTILNTSQAFSESKSNFFLLSNDTIPKTPEDSNHSTLNF